MAHFDLSLLDNGLQGLDFFAEPQQSDSDLLDLLLAAVQAVAEVEKVGVVCVDQVEQFLAQQLRAGAQFGA